MADAGQLRFLTCGSVDDGKSTLLGRLLYECGAIFEDQLAALERDSRRHGTTGEALDYALLLDGLEAEREQSITIDVAYRYFRSARRSFIAIDCPGHEQYTRNMATGASNAELAVLLVDARKGLLTQTRRHATICSLMGIRQVVLAVNKMDLLGFDQAAFAAIVAGFAEFARALDFTSVQAIPLSARFGDNVAQPSAAMPWYQGPSLLEALEAADTTTALAERPFRLPVQLVLRPDAEFRGFAGTVASGRVQLGETLAVAASGMQAQVARILGPDGPQPAAEAGEAVTLVLDAEIDIARGDLLVPPRARPALADQLAAHLVWLGEEPCLGGRQYLMRLGTRWVAATVTRIKHQLNVENLEHLAARELAANGIGLVEIAAVAPVAFDPYAEDRGTGAFILVDRLSHATVAAGMIVHALRRATNVHPEAMLIGQADRSALKGQQARCLWLTGLSGSGKSTLAKALEAALHRQGCHTMVLDGDNLRHGLNRNLGFTEADRVENIRRAGEVARLMTEAGLIVICAFISPYRADRDMVRALFAPGEFIEVFVDTPLDECIRRDAKGLYAKALRGEIPNFTGISGPYEPPLQPELHLVFAAGTAAALTEQQVRLMLERLAP